MQELVSRLTERAGLSTEQANKAIDTIKDFVKEKFPMMAGAVDNLLGSNNPGATAASSSNEGSFLDKISDFIPGETGQKVEDFAKNAASKVGGMLGGDKK